MQPELEVYCEVDVNECDRGGCGNITNSTCTNQYGSFSCTCSAGYELNAEGDACVDIDECKGSRNNCARNARCVNTESSFSCQCDAGYLTPEEVALLGNCSLAHVQGLLFRHERAGVRILFPSKGPGTVCVEANECEAHACATLAQLCIETNHTADGCDTLQWVNHSNTNYQAPDLASTVTNGSQSAANASNGTNNTGMDIAAAPDEPKYGVLVRTPPCPVQSQCHNTPGSFQVPNTPSPAWDLQSIVA
jgi:hypothetical protein